MSKLILPLLTFLVLSAPALADDYNTGCNSPQVSAAKIQAVIDDTISRWGGIRYFVMPHWYRCDYCVWEGFRQVCGTGDIWYMTFERGP